MPTVPITSEWWLDPGGDFERRPDGGDVVLWDGVRTVYASVFRGGNIDAEAAIAAMLDARKAAPLRKFDRVEANAIGHAYLLPEHDDEGEQYWGLNTWTASRGSVACVTFYFQGLDDLNWALAGWQSVQCGKCETYVN